MKHRGYAIFHVVWYVCKFKNTDKTVLIGLMGTYDSLEGFTQNSW